MTEELYEVIHGILKRQAEQTEILERLTNGQDANVCRKHGNDVKRDRAVVAHYYEPKQ